MKHCLAIVSIAALTGCALPSVQKTTGTGSANLGEMKTHLFKTGDAGKDQMTIVSALNETLAFCQPKLSGFEVETARRAKIAYALSMSGLIAGSVIAPALAAANAAANATWIAGLAGWAGATNFAGQALESSGLSGSASAQTRNTIIAQVVTQISTAADANKTFEERAQGILKARASCALYEIAVPSIPGAL